MEKDLKHKEQNKKWADKMVLQTKCHLDELGIVFMKEGDDVFCCVDHGGGEVKFKLSFIESLLAENNKRIASEVEKMKTELVYPSVPKGKTMTEDFMFIRGKAVALVDVLKLLDNTNK